MGSNPTSSEKRSIKLKMFFQLHITAKDKQILRKFLNFFLELQKTSSTWNVVSNSNKKDVITVLKSPHVNKTAQEQFEYRMYSKKILINSFKPSFFLLTLKKVKGLSFSGLSLRLTSWSGKDNNLNKNLKLLNPKNIVLKTDYQFLNINKNKQKLTKYIQLFDCQGETLLKMKNKVFKASLAQLDRATAF